MSNERFMRHHYGPSGYVEKSTEKRFCPTCGNSKMSIPDLRPWLEEKRREHERLRDGFKDLAAKLNHDSRSLAFLEVIKEIERREKLSDLSDINASRTKGDWEP